MDFEFTWLSSVPVFRSVGTRRADKRHPSREESVTSKFYSIASWVGGLVKRSWILWPWLCKHRRGKDAVAEAIKTYKRKTLEYIRRLTTRFSEVL